MLDNSPKHVKNTEMVDHVVNLNGLIPHLAERLFCRNLYVALPLDRCVYCVDMVKYCISQ